MPGWIIKVVTTNEGEVEAEELFGVGEADPVAALAAVERVLPLTANEIPETLTMLTDKCLEANSIGPGQVKRVTFL